MQLIDDNTYTSSDVAEAVLKSFVTEYEKWEDKQGRRNLEPPDYRDLALRMFRSYKTAKCYGY
tara:strand:- start:875 stop:1063 length:189 start_codon:yes stop_codon:yes gene_type:complete